jgi:2'-5' RNA ligase
MPTPGKMWRVFIAIELPRNVRARLAEHIETLRHSIPEARASWSREDNLHLTLKFLGDIPVASVERLSAAVSITATKVEPFEIVVEACGVFPARGQPKVLWIGIDDPSGKLSELNRALENECANAGFSSSSDDCASAQASRLAATGRSSRRDWIQSRGYRRFEVSCD